MRSVFAAAAFCESLKLLALWKFLYEVCKFKMNLQRFSFGVLECFCQDVIFGTGSISKVSV